MRKAARRDKNERQIIQALQAIGAEVIQVNQKDTFDLLVFFCKKQFVMEIKNPEYKPKKKPIETMLTTGEQKCKFMIESCGIKYHIIFTIEQAVQTVLNGTGRTIGGKF